MSKRFEQELQRYYASLRPDEFAQIRPTSDVEHRYYDLETSRRNTPEFGLTLRTYYSEMTPDEFAVTKPMTELEKVCYTFEAERRAQPNYEPIISHPEISPGVDPLERYRWSRVAIAFAGNLGILLASSLIWGSEHLEAIAIVGLLGSWSYIVAFTASRPMTTAARTCLVILEIVWGLASLIPVVALFQGGPTEPPNMGIHVARLVEAFAELAVVLAALWFWYRWRARRVEASAETITLFRR